MFRYAFAILLAAGCSGANAASVLIETNAVATGLSGKGVELGGFDFNSKKIETETSADGLYESASQKSIPNNRTSSLSSVNIVTGEIKSKIATDPGVFYGDNSIERDVYASLGQGFSTAEVIENFTGSGPGSFRFNIVFDGLWDIEGQPKEDGTFFNPDWSIQLNVALFAGSSSFNENFTFLSGVDPNNRSVSFNVTSPSAVVEEGQKYSVFVGLATEIKAGSKGFIDFSNTAKISFSADPGVTLRFSDERFLSHVETTPTPIPIPASGLLLAGTFLFLFSLRRRE